MACRLLSLSAKNNLQIAKGLQLVLTFTIRNVWISNATCIACFAIRQASSAKSSIKETDAHEILFVTKFSITNRVHFGLLTSSKNATVPIKLRHFMGLLIRNFKDPHRHIRPLIMYEDRNNCNVLDDILWKTLRNLSPHFLCFSTIILLWTV